MNLDDITPLAAILQDDIVMYAYNGAFNDYETAAWLEKQIQRYNEYGFGLWGIINKETQEMIGQCGITMQQYKSDTVPEIGYLLNHRYWHQGYATEAAAACKTHGFDILKFTKLYSIIRDTNIPSQKVAQRNGMYPVDIIIKHYRGIEMPHIVFCTTTDK